MLSERAPWLSLIVAFGLVSADCGGNTSSTSTGATGGASPTSSDATSTGATSGTAVGTSGTSSAGVGSTGTGGGSVSVGTGSVGVGGGSATGGAGGSSGDCPAGVDGSTLAGNWTGMGTRIGGPPFQVHISIDAQHLDIQTDRGAFSAITTGPSAFNVVYGENGGSARKNVAATQQFPGQLKLGVIPLDISGSWSFRNVLATGEAADRYGCDATLSAKSLSGTCSATRLPGWVSPYEPGTGSAKGAKTADAASIFGDLGGTWSVPISGGGCTFRFEGSTFTSDCGPKLGGMRITFCGSTASGTTSKGIEFSAQRM